jgi:integrase
MRCTETAQGTVADILFPSGKLRTEIRLRAAITKGCKQRCVYISSPKLIAALERYLTFRVDNRIGTFPEVENAVYRGLRPDLPLFITRKGSKFELNIKRRTLETGEQKEYLAADSLQSYITRLYAKAGIKGGSSHSGRRTFATRLYAQTSDMDVVQQLLGHDSPDCTMRYIECDPRILRQAFADVL